MANNVTKIYAAARFKWRSDTAQGWQTKNPVLLSGEPGVVTDGSESEKIKIGDGVTPWNDLGWWKGPKGDKGEAGNGGGGEIILDNYFTKDETAALIENAVNGHDVVTFDSDLPTPHQITATVMGTGYDLYTYHGSNPVLLAEAPMPSKEIYDSDKLSTRPVSCKLFTEMIGDIETALDELHTYAQSLVSGGSAE